MSANPMPDATFVVPVSNGIFEHCAKIGVAIWVFLWAVDRTTKETEGAGGCVEGLVYGGRPIRAQEIAAELQMAPRTVQTHLNHLVAQGYLRRLPQTSSGAASGYAVRKSKKWQPKLSIVRSKQAQVEPADFSGGALISAGSAPISAGVRRKWHKPRRIRLRIKETIHT